MIENSTLRVGGNSILVFIGKQISNLGAFLNKKGDKIVANNKTKFVTNPTAILINPFTLIINFTVDVNEKYQIVLQGDYKQNYRDAGDGGGISLTEDELFMIIHQNPTLWFKKY